MSLPSAHDWCNLPSYGVFHSLANAHAGRTRKERLFHNLSRQTQYYLDIDGINAPIQTPSNTNAPPNRNCKVIRPSANQLANATVTKGIRTKEYDVPDAVHQPKTNKYSRKATIVTKITIYPNEIQVRDWLGGTIFSLLRNEPANRINAPTGIANALVT